MLASITAAIRTEGEQTRKEVGILSERIANMEGMSGRVIAIEEKFEVFSATLESLQRELHEIKLEKSAPRGSGSSNVSTNIGGSASTLQWGNSANSQSVASAWTPSTALIRGFSPYNSGASTRLNKVDTVAAAAKILELLPPQERKLFRPLPPFVSNYQLQFQVAASAESSVVRAALEVWNEAITAKEHLINGHAVKASLEASPRRKLQYRNVNAAMEALIKAGVGKEKFEICHRSLQLVGSISHECVGSTPYASGTWAWRKSGILALGVTAAEASEIMEAPFH
jgi:hypothetical protein